MFRHPAPWTDAGFGVASKDVSTNSHSVAGAQYVVGAQYIAPLRSPTHIDTVDPRHGADIRLDGPADAPANLDHRVPTNPETPFDPAGIGPLWLYVS